MECSICFNPVVDKILMTCATQHAFCFKCLLGIIEANFELKGCPNCRGGDKFIMLTSEHNTVGVGFYSLEYFKKSLPILQKILGDSVTTNTCLVSELMLVCYVKNKKQLNLAHKLISADGTERSQKELIDDMVPYIKWDEKKSIEDIGMEVMGGLVEFFGTPPHRHEQPTPRLSEQRIRRNNEERPTHEQRDSRERGSRIISFSGSPSFLHGSFPFPFSSPNSE